MLKKIIQTAASCALVFAAIVPQTVSAAGKVSMFRLYNPNSGEHFYTGTAKERDGLIKRGWQYEGIGWTAPEKSSVPVYRLYNANAGDHHYTTDIREKTALVERGWKDEGIGWYSDEAKTVAVWREYNPKAYKCNHNYTADEAEHNALVSKYGWNDENVAWYALSGKSNGMVTLDRTIADDNLSNVLEFILFGYSDRYDGRNYDCENTDGINIVAQIAGHPTICWFDHYGLHGGNDHWKFDPDFTPDPQKKFTKYEGYIDYSLQEVKWAAMNVFHLKKAEVDDMTGRYTSGKNAYVKDGRLYVALYGGVGGPGYEMRYRSVKSDGRKIYVDYDAYVYDSDYFVGSYSAVVSHEFLNGRLCWTVWKHSDK